VTETRVPTESGGDRFAESRAHQSRSKGTLASGVASASRAAQLPVPICFAKGRGAHLTDVDGNDYIDYTLALGPMLLGHSPAPVIEAVQRQLGVGIGYGASHRTEAELAEAVCRTIPSGERVVFSSTGSEAIHAAIRIARAATGRTRIVKFLGHYHGWLDPIYIGVSALPATELGNGSQSQDDTGAVDPGLRELGTAGQDPLASASVTVCRWNSVAALEGVLGNDVAAVIMEPVNVNGGCILPQPGYLDAVRELTRRAGAVLIYDEIVTGYRLGLGGAQQRYGVLPDLTVLGKALGAGFPISAVCGSAHLMEEVASLRMAHMGTFNANPVCSAAALAAVRHMESHADEIYPSLDALTSQLVQVLTHAGAEAELPIAINSATGVVRMFISPSSVESYDDSLRANAAAMQTFTTSLVEQGMHVPARGVFYLSVAHTPGDIADTGAAATVAAMKTAREMAST
jgi:glutamate-1-semialdehyde 2,1-aminomutase